MILDLLIDPPVRCPQRGKPPINYQQLHLGNTETIEQFSSDEEEIVSNQEHAMQLKTTANQQPTLSREPISSGISQEEDSMNDLVSHFKQLKVENLKIELKDRGLNQKGRKKELHERLIEAACVTKVAHDFQPSQQKNTEQNCHADSVDDATEPFKEEVTKHEGNTAFLPLNRNTAVSLPTEAEDTTNANTPPTNLSVSSLPSEADDYTVEPLFLSSSLYFPSPPSTILSDAPPSSLASLGVRLA